MIHKKSPGSTFRHSRDPLTEIILQTYSFSNCLNTRMYFPFFTNFPGT